MATKKLYDLAVKTGTFTDKNGEEKGRWENVGSVLEMEEGAKMILLKRSFNPAGVPFKAGSDQIALSMFSPDKDKVKEQKSRQIDREDESAFGDDIPF